MKRGARTRPTTLTATGRPALALACACTLVAAWSCEPATEVGPLSPLLERPELQRLVEAGLDRETALLLAALRSADPLQRATAAAALASVQDPDARTALLELLVDPDAPVRRHAAFALGQLGPALAESSPGALSSALREERDPEVRLALLEAVGKSGTGEDLADLLGSAETRPGDAEALGLALALYHFGRRNITDPGAGARLIFLIRAEDPQVAVTAALALAAADAPDDWGVPVDDLRALLDTMAADRPAAGPLLAPQARAGDPADLERLIRWSGPEVHWRLRVAAVRALGIHLRKAPSGEAAAGITAALADPSHHVAEAAARTLVQWASSDEPAGGAAARVAPPPADAFAAWVVESLHRPLVASLLLTPLAGSPHDSLALAWARGELRADLPQALAFPALARMGTAEADTLLTEGLSGERRTAYLAAAALAIRLAALPPEHALRATVAPVVERQMILWGPHAPMSDLRGLLDLVRVLADGRPDLAGPLHDAASAHPHSLVRALAGVAPDRRAAPRAQVDWDALRQAGARPRLEVRTQHGTFLVELVPEAAPLAVSALLNWTRSGALDGLVFHRVEPDFILQSGDLDNPEGFGGPTRGLRTEITQIRYVPGVLGIASAGKDTEGSQYFITHGYSPSLDGRYGAVGRVVSGLDVADQMMLGDTVRSVIVLDATTRPSSEGGDADPP